MIEIPIDTANEFFTYEPDTGLLKMKKTRIGSPKKIGDIVGVKDSVGHLQVKILNRLYQVHRVAYAMHTDTQPIEIDHKNRVKDDNRFSNLREVTRAQNIQNTGARLSNKLGAKGIVTEGLKFRVDINGEYIGAFYSFHDAIAVANSCRKKIHGEYAHIDNLSDFMEVDNTPEFNIANVTKSHFGNVVAIGLDKAVVEYNISKSSYYRIKKHYKGEQDAV